MECGRGLELLQRARRVGDTDALGNAPYDGGYGPPNEWFDETTGAYSGYDVYISTTGARRTSRMITQLREPPTGN